MNRRTFIAALTLTPVVARIPGPESVWPHAERRFRLARSTDHDGWIQVKVQLALTERIARGIRNQEAHDPFDGLVGEFYIDDAHPVEIPGHLPGTLTTYETIVGVAAARGVIHTGGFRRGRYVWTVRVGGDVSWAIEVAEGLPRSNSRTRHAFASPRTSSRHCCRRRMTSASRSGSTNRNRTAGLRAAVWLAHS